MENRIFPALRAFKPELIILSAGFDAAKGDVGNSKLDTGKGGIDLTVKDYERLTESTTFYNHVLLFMSCFVYFLCLIQFLVLLDWTFQLIFLLTLSPPNRNCGHCKTLWTSAYCQLLRRWLRKMVPWKKWYDSTGSKFVGRERQCTCPCIDWGSTTPCKSCKSNKERERNKLLKKM